MGYSFEKTLELHQELWDKVADLCRDEDYTTADSIKSAALDELGYKEITMDCFCCDYTGYDSECAHKRDFNPCKRCPLDWGVTWYFGMPLPPCCMSYFDEFDCALQDYDFEEAEELAYKIANLPINPIYKGGE